MSVYDDFEKYIFDHENQIENIMIDSIYQNLMNAVSGITRESALRIAKESAGRLIKDILDGSRSSLAKIIEQGLLEQKDMRELTKDISKMIGLREDQLDKIKEYEEQLKKKGYSDEQIKKLVDKESERKIRERSEVIARTETRMAIESAELEFQKENGAKRKVWIASDNCCDECLDNVSIGSIGLDEDFPSGRVPPAHPNCRCSVAYNSSDNPDNIKDFEQRAIDRAEKIRNSREEEDG